MHVDETALRNAPCGGGRADLPLETVRRLCCDGSVVPVVEDGDGEPLNVGRKQRTVPTGLRRALAARDKGCCFPGCTYEKWIDAHHIVHWCDVCSCGAGDGGETKLDNLLSLCTFHRALEAVSKRDRF